VHLAGGHYVAALALLDKQHAESVAQRAAPFPPPPQAARAAALASVPGAAAYAGKRAVEVTLVRYGGTVVQVNRERQFGFIAYSEDSLFEAAGSAAASAAPAGKAAPAASSPAAADGAAPAAQAVSEEVVAVPVAPAVEEAAPYEAAEGSTAGEAAADGGESGGAGAAAPPAPASEQPKKRLFFHFKEARCRAEPRCRPLRPP
jgi:hypothetical protein